MVYDAADIPRAGVFVSIDPKAGSRFNRGYVRSEDEAPVTDAETGQDADAPSTDGREITDPEHGTVHLSAGPVGLKPRR